MMHTVLLTAHFERNLQSLETFLVEADAAHAFDALLNALTETVIPNLERFPGMGRLFLEQPVHSVELAHRIEKLAKQLASLSQDGELREYVMAHYLLLYACIDGMIYLLCIRHHRQQSFDFVPL